MDKQTLRREILNIRKDLIIDPLSYKTILDSHILDKFNNIAIYYPLKGEIDLLKLLELDKNFYFPKTIDDKTIEFYLDKDIKNFKKGAFNVMEPSSDIKALRDDIEVFLVPCVGITVSGLRIGYGKGYYDRYLSGYKGLIIGVCLDSFMNVCDVGTPLDIKVNIKASEVKICLV